jgi:hypothetical protein
MKTKSYERVWVLETSKPGKETEFRRRESIHCKAETPDIALSFFVALRLILKAGQ